MLRKTTSFFRNPHSKKLAKNIKLEKVLRAITGNRDYCKIQTDISSGTDIGRNCSRNDDNKASRLKRMDIKANYSAKIPIPVKKLAKAGRSRNLTSHEYNQKCCTK